MKNQNLKILLIMAGFFAGLLAFGKQLFGAVIAPGTILKKAAEFIAVWEGFVPAAFWDYKQYTNGYGTKALTNNERITKEVALTRLAAECNRILNVVNVYRLILTDSQKIGLVSFGYNLGDTPMKLMCQRLQSGLGVAFVAGKMNEYTKAGGTVLAQLVRRRKAESDLLLKKTTV